MIDKLIGGFVAILIGVSLVGTVAEQTMYYSATTNASGQTCTYAVDSARTQCSLYMSSTWAPTVLKMTPGFFALGILGVGIAVTYGSLRDAGIV